MFNIIIGFGLLWLVISGPPFEDYPWLDYAAYFLAIGNIVLGAASVLFDVVKLAGS